MLFICHVCKFGHDSTNVEQFIDPSTHKHSYFCKQHINHTETTALIHIPWITDTITDRMQFCVTRNSVIEYENQCISAATKSDSGIINYTYDPSSAWEEVHSKLKLPPDNGFIQKL